MPGETDSEPWWNVALLRVSWAVLLCVCAEVVYICVSQRTTALNLLRLRGDIPKILVKLIGAWVAARMGMSIWHYSACNSGHVAYCYLFLEDLFSSLYACLLLMCGFLNAANSLLIVFYALFTFLQSPITCWWMIVWSVIVLGYQFWAMGYLAADRAQAVGLLHLNYALVVHYLLAIFAYPPASNYTWNEKTSVWRDWQALAHVLVVLCIARLLWLYLRREGPTSPSKEAQSMTSV